MTAVLQPGHPLRRLFAGLVEQVFEVDLGICSPTLTDYLADLLSDFVHIDRIYRLRTVSNETISDISRMEADATLGPGVNETRRRRQVNRYIGDFTLFWTGVYPENLHPRRQSGADRLREYLLQGKRSYGIAGELTAPDEEPPADILVRLSDQFEYCAHGLHLVRASWERLGRPDAA